MPTNQSEEVTATVNKNDPRRPLIETGWTEAEVWIMLFFMTTDVPVECTSCAKGTNCTLKLSLWFRVFYAAYWYFVPIKKH